MSQGVPKCPKPARENENCRTNPRIPSLTARQLAAARLIAQGKRSEEVGKALDASKRTIDRWRRTIRFQVEVRRLHDLIMAGAGSAARPGAVGFLADLPAPQRFANPAPLPPRAPAPPSPQRPAAPPAASSDPPLPEFLQRLLAECEPEDIPPFPPPRRPETAEEEALLSEQELAELDALEERDDEEWFEALRTNQLKRQAAKQREAEQQKRAAS